jgi:beta-glucosidase
MRRSKGMMLLLLCLVIVMGTVPTIASAADEPGLRSLDELKTGTWTDAQKKDLIKKVVAQLTLDEKVDLIGGTKGSTADGTAVKNSGAAGGTYTSTRLKTMGITPLTLSDGPAGVRMGYKATTWTSPTSIASSWDNQIMHDIAVQTGKEASFYGIDVMLSPGQNILRNPQSGRNFEYFSEDPLLSGQMAKEYTLGVQSQNVGVTLKHYAGNEQETYRSGGNVIVSERALREVYLKGFEIAAEAKPWSIMASYNRLNSIYAASNEWLMTDVLRNDFGFDGFVMSDWGATNDIVASMRAQMDLTESSLSAANKTTLKNAIANGQLDVSYLDRSVENILDGVVKSNTFIGEYGAVGAQYDLVEKEKEFYASELFQESNDLAHQTAAESMVLLRNDDELLPLQAGSKVGLITSSNLKGRGGFGDNSVTSSDFVSRGGGSAGVYFDPTHESVVSLESALQDKYTVTNKGNVKDIKEAAGYTKTLSYSKTADRVTGITLNYSGAFDQTALEASAAALAQSADYGLYVVSRQTGEGADNVTTGNDSYYLTTEEEKALQAYAYAFHSQGKQLIVILNIGAALDTNVINEYADAILVSWLPGQEGGRAITDVLSGAVNPSGKLTQTFTNDLNFSPSVEAAKALPARTFTSGGGNTTNSATTNGGWGTNPVFYDEGVLVGYKWFDTKYKTEAEYNAKIAYPFGYGLSYTKFEFSDLQLSKTVFDQNNDQDSVTATVKVKNVGNVKGKEVVQMYLGMDNYATEGRPMKDLRGYEKVELNPGEEKTVSFTIALSDLQYYDDGFNETLDGTATTSNVTYGNGKGWTVTPGSIFNVMIGNTSNNFVLNSDAKQGVAASFAYSTPETTNGAAELTGPATVVAGQPVDLSVSVKGVEDGFSTLSVVVNYDSSKLEFATVADEEGIVSLASDAIASTQPGIQILGTAVKPESGQILLILSSTGQLIEQDSQLFVLHGKAKSDALGTANVFLNEFEIAVNGQAYTIDTAAASLNIQVTAADHTALAAAVTNAEQLLAGAVEGTQPGQYQAGSKAELQAAIAQAVIVRDNAAATQQQIANAVSALNQAVSLFLSKVNSNPGTPEADKAALNKAIAAAQLKLTQVQEGTKVGQYPASAISALQSAIQSANAVSNNANATQTAVDQATTSLNAAIADFATKLITLVPGQTEITIRDLSYLAKYFGVKSTDADWANVDKADMFGAGEITIRELAAVARLIISNWMNQ